MCSGQVDTAKGQNNNSISSGECGVVYHCSCIVLHKFVANQYSLAIIS